MRKGAKSFSQFSVLAIPTVLGFVYLTGIKTGVIALVGIFLVLTFANHLDRSKQS